jgi:predicted secreted protein
MNLFFPSIGAKAWRHTILPFCLFFIQIQLGSSQVVVAKQDFETTPAAPVLTFANTGGAVSSGTNGASGNPANANLFSGGSKGWQLVNGTSTLTFSNQSLAGYSNVRLKVRLAGMSVNNSDGIDNSDFVAIAIAANGGSFLDQLRVTSNGNATANRRWAFSGANTATRLYSTSSILTATTGGGSNGISTMEITFPTAITEVQVKITLLNNSANERWVIDDVIIEGCPSVTAFAYPSVSASYCKNQAIAAINPTTTPGSPAVYTYAVSPALPAGLGIDANTGAITGTPTDATASATYTVTATRDCGSTATSNITFGIQELPNAGTNGTLTICAGSTLTASDLFAALGGIPDAGGTWSPALAGAGVYTYTVAATLPCTTDASATVTVSEQAQPNAGTNGTLTICAGSTLTTSALSAALGGTPDAGGTWSPALAGAAVYTYTVAATAPCTSDATATVTVSEQTLPNAGTNGTLTICAGSTLSVSALFAALGGSPDAGGTWSPVLAGVGVYTYTVAATSPCTSDASASVAVSEQIQPNAGTNGTLTICAGSTLAGSALFAALGGTPDAGGTWSPALAGAGVYTYTVAATAPCSSDANATITVSELAQPNAGIDGAFAICPGTTITTVDLLAVLTGNPDAGGTWSPSPGGAGTYTYTIAANTPCSVHDAATVTVTNQTVVGIFEGVYYCSEASLEAAMAGFAAANPMATLHLTIEPGAYSLGCLVIGQSTEITFSAGASVQCLEMDAGAGALKLMSDIQVETLNLTQGLIRTNSHKILAGSISGGDANSFVITD